MPKCWLGSETKKENVGGTDSERQRNYLDAGQYVAPSFGGAKQVFRYLGRYTHRVAIANSRLLEEFGGSYRGWHYCESPLVDGDKVIVTPGGKDATMLALDKTTGKRSGSAPSPPQAPRPAIRLWSLRRSLQNTQHYGA
jgi:hypothetical protein